MPLRTIALVFVADAREIFTVTLAALKLSDPKRVSRLLLLHLIALSTLYFTCATFIIIDQKAAKLSHRKVGAHLSHKCKS